MSLTQINKAGLDEIALDHVFTIGASGSSAYTFQGEGLNGTVNNPTLYLTRGKTYRFENGSGGHPIRIQSTSGASGTAYNTGVTNNAGSGTVIVEVQHDAPDVLYYQCTSHAAMNGILYITGALADGGVTTAKIADSAIISSKIADSAVSASKLGSAVVSTTKIQDNAVNTTKIADDAVTIAKLADDAVGTTQISDQAVTLAKLPHGTSSNDGKFLRANNGADPTFETVNTDLVSDTSPQLGGDLDTNSQNIAVTGGNNITMGDNSRLRLGASNDVDIYHNGSHSYFDNTTGTLHIRGQGDGIRVQQTNGEDMAKFIPNGAVELYHNNGLRLSTGSSQVTLHRPSSFPNPNNTGSEITGATLDIGGNLHLEERYPNGAYADRQDLVLKTNTGYGQGLNDKVRFSSSGSIFLEVAGSGISFEPHGSSNANLLDDYEEGTWTPSVHSGGGSLSTYVATYTKIGRLVHIHCYVSYTTANSSSVFQMGGLPFACINDNYEVNVVDFGVGGKKGAYCRTHTGNTFLEFLFSSESNTGNRQPIRGTHIGSGYIILSNTYITS